jgi:hypothetical protein
MGSHWWAQVVGGSEARKAARMEGLVVANCDMSGKSVRLFLLIASAWAGLFGLSARVYSALQSFGTKERKGPHNNSLNKKGRELVKKLSPKSETHSIGGSKNGNGFLSKEVIVALSTFCGKHDFLLCLSFYASRLATQLYIAEATSW